MRDGRIAAPTSGATIMSNVRPCRDSEFTAILAIVNTAAEAYRGVIPPDRWHEPYMPPEELRRQIGAGVTFWGCQIDDDLVGVMGVQTVRDVDLIRHAYVRPDHQRRGVGAALIEHLRNQSRRRMLVGTWTAAHWAIAFYKSHGFEQVSPKDSAVLLKTYWTIPNRQIETSVVLSSVPLVGRESQAEAPEHR
jgi:GNAT superfamily N-acetyltransferase